MSEVIFCMQIVIKVFCKLALSFWMGITIPRKKSGMKFIRCMQINFKDSLNLIVSHLMGVVRHGQSTENNIFIIFDGHC